MSSSGASRAAVSPASSSTLRERRFEVGEARLRRDVGAAEAQPAPFGERMQRRVLHELRGGPLDPGVRRRAEPGAEFLDEPRLAEARLADDLHELALAAPRALPAAQEQREFLLAADEGA